MPKTKGDIIFDTLQDLGILVGDKWNYIFSSDAFFSRWKKRKIEYASSDRILSPNYIYILWNGLNVGHYGQGTVYLLYTSTEINLANYYDSEGVDGDFFDIRFDMSVNCPNGVEGVCWKSQDGGDWIDGSDFDWDKLADTLNDSVNIRKLMLFLSELDQTNHTYKIPLNTTISNKIRSLNYAKKGIGL